MARAHLLAVSGALIFGIAVGVHSGPVPETRFIKGPTVYKTQTETKEVTVKTPLPDSCIKAIGLVKEVTNPFTNQADSLGKISLALQAFGTASESGSGVKASNDALEVIRKQKDRLDTAWVASLQAEDQLDSWYEQCQSDMKGS